MVQQLEKKVCGMMIDGYHYVLCASCEQVNGRLGLAFPFPKQQQDGLYRLSLDQ